MAVVATQLTEVPLLDGSTIPKSIRINFSQKVGGFYINIDETWTSFFTDQERRDFGIYMYRDRYIIENDTFEKVLFDFKTFINRAIKKVRETKREKVLIVHFESVSLEETHFKSGGISTSFSRLSDRFNEKDITRMTFSYRIAYKCGEVFFNEEMRNLWIDIGSNKFIIKWTEKREKFFFQIHLSFHGMISNITKFLKTITESPALLDNHINKGLKLLPEVKKEPK